MQTRHGFKKRGRAICFCTAVSGAIETVQHLTRAPSWRQYLLACVCGAAAGAASLWCMNWSARITFAYGEHKGDTFAVRWLYRIVFGSPGL